MEFSSRVSNPPPWAGPVTAHGASKSAENRLSPGRKQVGVATSATQPKNGGGLYCCLSANDEGVGPMNGRRSRFVVFPLALLFGPVALYFGAALGLEFWPANSANQPPSAGYEIFVATTGVHADLVMPVSSPIVDWRRVFAPSAFERPPARPRFVAVGWGDRTFYLQTRAWSDLTAGRALRALAGGNPTVLHVRYLSSTQALAKVYGVALSGDQYARLADHVIETLARPEAITGAAYGVADAFFEAKGAYNLFNTCNTWVGRGLLRAGVKVARWTPLERNLLRHLGRVEGPNWGGRPGP